MSDEIIDVIVPFVDKALKMGADEVELFAERAHEKSANFESNQFKSATGSILEGVGIRVLINHQLGFASVNSLSPDRIEQCLRDAISIARSTPSIPHYRLPSAEEIKQVSGIYDPAVDELSMTDVLTYAKELLKGARDYDSRVSVDSGTFMTSSISQAIVSSHGIQASENRTRVEWMIFGMAIDGDDVGSFDYDFDSVVAVSDIDLSKTVNSFCEKVLSNLGAVKSEPFEGPAIFTPDALMGLLDVLITSATATQVQAGSSHLADRLGEEIAVPEFTLIDDGTVDGQVGSGSFDREGVPHHRLPIVQNGVFKGILYDTFTANKEDLSSTGHATGTFRTAPTISSTNLIMNAGNKDLDAIISEIDTGILIPRISAFPDSVSGDFTGPVKGGRLIKNGEVTSTLKEITITGNFFEGIKNIIAISKERKHIRYQSDTFLVPYVTMSGMKFAT